jgi:hypothetical protein
MVVALPIVFGVVEALDGCILALPAHTETLDVFQVLAAASYVLSDITSL